MRKTTIFTIFTCLIALGLFTQCERYGQHFDNPLGDDDSDRPSWAGGNTDENPHINKNDDSGTTRGGDYGDLYQLLRDVNGVPQMIQIGSEYYVQPVDVNGIPLELNEEGELVDASQALDMGLINAVVPLEKLEEETVSWCREMLAHSPTALRALKSAFNADTDGLAGIQELAGNTPALFYMSEEGQKVEQETSFF